MPKYDKYHPDYGSLYPEIQARPDVLSVLKKSDRKMEYMEVDIKQERFSYDPEGKVADLLPGREDSYDRLMEEEHRQFSIDEPTPEAVMLHEEELWLLRTALLQLTAEEKALVDALFYQELTEREYAQQLGISQKGVNKRRHKVLAKLKKIIKK